MCRIQNSLLVMLILFVVPVATEAQEQKQMTLAELQEMVLQQQQLLEQQSQLIEAQTLAINSLRTQFDQLAQAAGQVSPELTDEELALQERLAKVEEELQKPPDTPENVLTAGEFPGSMRIPGTNMAMKFGGNVRLGVTDSFDPIGSTDRFVAGTIPVAETETGDLFNEGFVISAKRSRLNWDMRLDSSYGQFRAFVEGDFAGTAGSSEVLRLRHAYGQYNRFILGQTWSTLMDTAAIPEDVDFEGLNAQINVRQPELRWIKGLGNNRPFSLGFEDPSPSVTGGAGISRFPDSVATLKKEGDWGHLQLGAILRNIVGIPLDEVGAELRDQEDATFGWGLSFSGNLAARKWDERDNFKFQLNVGDGLGRYINDLGTVGGFDAAFDPETLDLKTLPVVAAYGAFQHWWALNPFGLFKAVRSTVVYGYVRVEDLDFLPDDFYHSTQRASVNWLWSPISQIDLGMEFLWGSRTNKNRERGNARQLQFVATFRF